MKRDLPVQGEGYPVLERIWNEYSSLLISDRFSLQVLFSSDQCQVEDYCKQFSPHPQSHELLLKAEEFGKAFGIWDKASIQNVTCALYLYPAAFPDRMLTIMKNILIDFFLNDTMGRDTHTIKKRETPVTPETLDRLVKVTEELSVPENADKIEYANHETLSEFKRNSPANWFREFLRLYDHHIAITHRNLNTSALGRIPTVEEYIEMRNHVSGMNHVIVLIEYSDNNFIDWVILENTPFYQSLRRLQRIAATFGALSNDLFSFEKEVIDHKADSNLVAIVAMNNPAFSLQETIILTTTMVRNLLEEFVTLMKEIETLIEEYALNNPGEAVKVRKHLEGLVRVIQASWTWQANTKRYKRKQSIWKETFDMDE